MILLVVLALFLTASSSGNTVTEVSHSPDKQKDIETTIQYLFTGTLYNGSVPLQWSAELNDPKTELFQKYYELVHEKFGDVLNSAQGVFGVPIFEIETVLFFQQGDVTSLHVAIQIFTVEFQKIEQPQKTVFDFIENKIRAMEFVKHSHSNALAKLRFKLTFWPKSEPSLLPQSNDVKHRQMCDDIERYLGLVMLSYFCRLAPNEHGNYKVTATVDIHITQLFTDFDDAFKDASKMKQFLEVKFDGNSDRPSNWIIVYDEDTILWNTRLTISGTFYANKQSVEWNPDLLNQQSALFNHYSGMVIDKVSGIQESVQNLVKQPVVKFDQFQFEEDGSTAQLKIMFVYTMNKYEENKQTTKNLENVIPSVFEQTKLLGVVDTTHVWSTSRAIIPPDDLPSSRKITPPDDIESTIKYIFIGTLYDESEPLEWSTDLGDPLTELIKKYYQLAVEEFGDILTSAQEVFGVPIFEIDTVQIFRNVNVPDLHVTIQISNVGFQKIAKTQKTIFDFIEDKIKKMKFAKSSQSYALAKLRFKLTFWPKSDPSLLHQSNDVKHRQMCDDIERYLGVEIRTYVCQFLLIKQENNKVTFQVTVQMTQSFTVFDDAFKDLSIMKQFLEVKFDGNSDRPSNWIIVYDEDTILWNTRLTISGTFHPIKQAVKWNPDLLNQQSALFKLYGGMVIDKVNMILVSVQKLVENPVLEFDQFQFEEDGSTAQLKVMLVYTMHEYEATKQTTENFLINIRKVEERIKLIQNVHVKYDLSSSRKITSPDDIESTIQYIFIGTLYDENEPLEWSTDLNDPKTAMFQKYHQLVHEQFGDILSSAQGVFGVPLLKIETVVFQSYIDVTSLGVTIRISDVELGNIVRPLKAIFDFIEDKIKKMDFARSRQSYALTKLRFKLMFRPKSVPSLLRQPNKFIQSKMCDDIKRYLGPDITSNDCKISLIEQDNGKVTAHATLYMNRPVSILDYAFKNPLTMQLFLASNFNGNTHLPLDWIIDYDEDKIPDSFDDYDKQKTNTILKTYVEVRNVEKIKEIGYQNTITTEMETKFCELFTSTEFILSPSAIQTVDCHLIKITQASSLTAELYFIYPQNMVSLVRVDHNPSDFLHTIKMYMENRRDSLKEWDVSVTNSRLHQLGNIETVIQLTISIQHQDSSKTDDTKGTLPELRGKELSKAACKQTSAQLQAGDSKLTESMRGCWTFMKSHKVVQFLFVSWKDLHDAKLYSNKAQLENHIKQSLDKGQDAVESKVITFDEIEVLYVNDDVKVPFEGFLMKYKWDDKFRQSDSGEFIFAWSSSTEQLKSQFQAGFENFAEAFKGLTVTKFSPSSDRVKMNGYVVISKMELIAQNLDLKQVPTYLNQAYNNGRNSHSDEAITNIQFASESKRSHELVEFFDAVTIHLYNVV